MLSYRMAKPWATGRGAFSSPFPVPFLENSFLSNPFVYPPTMITNNLSWSLGSVPARARNVAESNSNKTLDHFEIPIPVPRHWSGLPLVTQSSLCKEGVFLEIRSDRRPSLFRSRFKQKSDLRKDLTRNVLQPRTANPIFLSQLLPTETQ
jgi:hypothetical protein